MTCSPKHVTYQKERRLTSPQKPLTPVSTPTPSPAKVAAVKS